jgi:hypothetical protein
MRLLVLALAYPMLADNFAERWPEPVATDPAPAIIDPYPVQRTPPTFRSAHARVRFVCHRQTYYRGRHRYWRCRR